MTVVVDKGYAWIARSDGVAHAHFGSRALTLCGQRRVDPRYAWPIVSRCGDCQRVASGGVGPAPREVIA